MIELAVDRTAVMQSLCHLAARFNNLGGYSIHEGEGLLAWALFNLWGSIPSWSRIAKVKMHEVRGLRELPIERKWCYPMMLRRRET